MKNIYSALAVSSLIGFSVSSFASWTDGLQSKHKETGKIGATDIAIIVGDMTQVKADAHIVPHFESAVSYGGVGGAVARSGAEPGMEEFGRFLEGSGGTLPFGTARVTASGGGNSDKLINVVSVGSGSADEFRVVSDSIYNALVEAHKNGIKTVALPALGTGIIGQLTGKQSADAALSGINRFVREGGHMDGVAIVIFGDQESWKGYTKSLKSGSYETATSKVGGREFDPNRWQSNMKADLHANNETGIGSNVSCDGFLGKLGRWMKPRQN